MFFLYILLIVVDINSICSEKNIHAMRMGPGKHLKGRVLMDGLVKPEEVSAIVYQGLRIINDAIHIVRLFPRTDHHPRARALWCSRLW